MKRVAHYEIKELIGKGAMGEVYRATDSVLHRDVALKVMSHENADAEAKSRFSREAHALARIDHPHVVRVYASGEEESLSWMALELVEGRSLADHLDQGPFDEETAFALGAQLARGLAAVHDEGVLHRDLKPENLLIDGLGLLRIVDFGIAFVENGRDGFRTSAGIAVGTPHYMSPEQARGEALDTRVDAWGVGATLFALLIGHPPFFEGDKDEAELEILARVLRDDAPCVQSIRPEVSIAGARFVELLLSRDKSLRPSDMRDVAELLDMISSGAYSPDEPYGDRAETPVHVEPPAHDAIEAPKLTPSPARWPALVVVAVVLAVCVSLALYKANESATSMALNVPEQKVDAPLVLPTPKKVNIEEAKENEALEAEDDARGVTVAALWQSNDSGAKALLHERVSLYEHDAQALLDILDDKAARDKGVEFLEAILFGKADALHNIAIERLERARNFKALAVLQRAEKEHHLRHVRAQAKKARLSIFSIEP